MVTETECIAALRAVARRLGESPTKAEYEKLGLQPASATIIRQFGGWNAAKEAAGLATNPSTGSRVGEKPDDVALPDGVSWNDLSVDQRWHYRNREWNTERTLRRRARLRAWLNERKREYGCARCGCSDPACLDFHHREGSRKELSVGRMVTHGYGRDALEDEMDKCEVLCANCHRREHHTEPDDDLRRWLHERKADLGGCSDCGEDDVPCLDFHHTTGEKTDTVASMVTDARPREVINAEIAKCEVLCANCHRRLHFEPPDDGQRPEHDNHK